MRYYFGAKKSLRDRQRQDDPPGLMQQVLHGLGLYGAEYNQKGNAYSLAHGGVFNSGDYGVDRGTVKKNPPEGGVPTVNAGNSGPRRF